MWDKTNSRPQRGRFRQEAEFVVWGSNGHMPIDRKAPVLPGVFRQSMPSSVKRRHQTEKPLEVMREMVRIVEPGGTILDPFAGAGTTIEAARLEGYPAVGIELSAHSTPEPHESASQGPNSRRQGRPRRRTMPGVSREQVEAARQVDLLSYLREQEPDNLRRAGGEFCLRDHDSL